MLKKIDPEGKAKIISHAAGGARLKSSSKEVLDFKKFVFFPWKEGKKLKTNFLDKRKKKKRTPE